MKKDYKYICKAITLPARGVETYYCIVVTLKYENDLEATSILHLNGMDLIFNTTKDAEEYIQHCLNKRNNEVFDVQEYKGYNMAYLCHPIKISYYKDKIEEILDTNNYKQKCGNYNIFTKNETSIRICFKESEFDILYDFKNGELYFNPYNNKTRTIQETVNIADLLKEIEQAIL